MWSRSSSLSSAAVFSLIFVLSCKPPAGADEKSASTSVKSQNVSEIQSDKPERPSVQAGNSKTLDKPFVAVLKRTEPVPDALMTGMISISNNCLIVEIQGDASKKLTVAVPAGYKFLTGSKGEPLIQIGKRVIPMNKNIPVPGGTIFVDPEKDIEGKIPASCPSDVFGIGE